MLIAILGTLCAARSAAGESILMFGMKYLGFVLATVLALGKSIGDTGAEGSPASDRRGLRGRGSSRQTGRYHRRRKMPKYGGVIDALC